MRKRYKEVSGGRIREEREVTSRHSTSELGRESEIVCEKDHVKVLGSWVGEREDISKSYKE